MMREERRPTGARLEPGAAPFRVGEWIAEPAWNRIRRDGDIVKLEPRVMRLLATLAAEPGRPLARQQLLETVWPDVLVNEEALSRAVSQLRRALGDDPKAPRFVETVHKGGYCLIAPLSDEPGGAKPPPVAGPARSRRWVWPLIAIVVAGLVVAILYSGVERSRSGEALKQLVPLTSDPGREIDPAVSPDGSHVVYLASSGSGYDLFVRGIDDPAPIRLTRDALAKGHPVWSPDGKRIGFVAAADDGAGIYIVTSSGGPATKLIDLPSWSFGLDWSPDGRTLAYSDAGPGEAPRIVLLDLASKAARPIAIGGSSAADVKPVFSPDGKRIAFIRNDALDRQQIAVVDIDGNAGVHVVGTAPQQVRGLDWAPDGQSLIYSARAGRRFGLWRVAADGSGAPQPLPVEGGDLFNPSVSSNGRIIVEDVEQDRDVWSASLGGEAAAPLIRSTFDDYEPAYAGDGALAFVSERSGTSEVWLRSAAGGEWRLTEVGGPDIGSLAWAPEGKRLAFVAEDRGVAAIYAATRNGEAERLRRAPAGSVPIGWSAAGDRLFMVAPEGPRWRLEAMNVATGESRRITALPVEAAAVAGDGQSIFAITSGENRLLQIDPNGRIMRQVRLPASLGRVSAVLPAGRLIYLIVEDQGTALVHRFDLNTAGMATAARIEHFAGGKISLSPDGRSLAYTQGRETANDLAWAWL